jgi:acetoin utilization deacetylase AcuC-like enzyme
MFANGVLAALELKRLGAERILYLDWDAHHGNSQQGAFWSDPSVLTISVHQARAFPPGTGGTDARGAGQGYGTNINIPVPPGSGGGVYRTAFKDVIRPAAEAFRPDFVLVSSGLDASYIDPSARLCLHSGDYEWMTDQVITMAGENCDGRLVMTHEGGYSLPYLPLCFLRIVERLSGCRTGIVDPFLARWGTTLPRLSRRRLGMS